MLGVMQKEEGGIEGGRQYIYITEHLTTPIADTEKSEHNHKH
jgi:hypothetical protein